jgi:hypothetical protein
MDWQVVAAMAETEANKANRLADTVITKEEVSANIPLPENPIDNKVQAEPFLKVSPELTETLVLVSAPKQEVIKESPEKDTQQTQASKDFNLVEMLEEALVGGNLALLKQGSKHRDAITFAQKTLVETGFLQTTDKNADNYINPKDFGVMDGKVTINAMSKLQQSMKAAGADIKIDSIDNVRCYTETWTALATVKHLGIKDGNVTDEAAELYNSNKNDSSLKDIAFNPNVVNAVSEIAANTSPVQASELMNLDTDKSPSLRSA